MGISRRGSRWTRRRWLSAAAVAAVVGPAGVRARQEPPADAGSDPEGERLDRIRRRAAEAGLPDLTFREARRYVALGTAPDDFLSGALRLCDGLALDFLQHFSEKGFAVEEPEGRMTLVGLADQGQFNRFLGTDQHPDVTGIYEIGPNYLVLYDGRSGGPAGPRAERANTITLFHEATHQLTFNTGLLDPNTDAPLAILEGLAMYGEVRRPDGRTRIGAVNPERLGVIVAAMRGGESLLPLPELLADDRFFERDDTVQLAYSQSWLLVYALMRERRAVERFRAYLEALKRPDPSRPRVELAEEHLGDLDQLDRFMKGVLGRINRGR